MQFQLIFAMQLHLGFRNETFDEISAAMRADVRYLSSCGRLSAIGRRLAIFKDAASPPQDKTSVWPAPARSLIRRQCEQKIPDPRDLLGHGIIGVPPLDAVFQMCARCGHLLSSGICQTIQRGDATASNASFASLIAQLEGRANHSR
jgi:hypothetical protein